MQWKTCLACAHHCDQSQANVHQYNQSCQNNNGLAQAHTYWRGTLAGQWNPGSCSQGCDRPAAGTCSEPSGRPSQRLPSSSSQSSRRCPGQNGSWCPQSELLQTGNTSTEEYRHCASKFYPTAPPGVWLRKTNLAHPQHIKWLTHNWVNRIYSLHMAL